MHLRRPIPDDFIYHNAANKRPGDYLIFEDPEWALIRGGRLFKNMSLTLS